MRWLPYLNTILAMMALGTGTLFFFPFSNQNEIVLSPPHSESTELPKRPFPYAEDVDLRTGAFALKWVPPQMQLPDLRDELQFFGQNGRPDAEPRQASYHIGLKSSGECCTIHANERIYLVYQSNYSHNYVDRRPKREPIITTPKPIWGDVSPPSKGNYLFSPGNQPTPLWIQAMTKAESSLSLCVHMLDEQGNLVESPGELRLITPHVQEFSKSQITAWELGNYRVDSTLLVRQKARWIGSDCFLSMHGGEDFAYTIGREKIDFLDGEHPYSCFIGADDFLIWKHNRWNLPQKGEKTEGFPLLSIKKIDEKLMTLELWDVFGRSKTTLSLIRIKDHHKTPNLSQEFKFVGAKTWAQFIIECRNGERLTLKPHDWLVLTQDGWKKLDSSALIDDYVDGKLNGPLFILDKLSKINGRQVLVGHLFNTSRTEVEEIELEATSTTSLANSSHMIPFIPPIRTHLEGGEE